MITAYIFIITKPGGRVDVSPEALAKIEGIKDIIEVYGEYDVVLKVQVTEMDGLQELIKKIRELGGVEKTTTMIAMTTGKRTKKGGA
jgi:DNA-binding Lrp family transcriptional regulator